MSRYKYVSIASVLALFAITNPAFAQPAYKESRFQPYLTRGSATFTFSAGARHNNFDWNIASDLSGTETPNILSELTWRDVQLVELKERARYVEPADIGSIRGSIQIDAELSAGVAVQGKNQDLDYLDDNREFEFSRSNNDADNGYLIGGQAAVGYKFHLAGPSQQEIPPAPTDPYRRRVLTASDSERPYYNTLFSLTPSVGYGWSRQSYWIKNGLQTVSFLPGLLTPFLGPFENLNSEYSAEWSGPFVGLEAELEDDRSLLRLRGQYHVLDYYGEGIWNLRDTFKQDPSFTHEADGYGYLLNTEYAYALNARYAFVVDADYQKRYAEDGIDTVFLTDGGTPSTKLNEVNDESYAVHFGIRYNW